MNLLLVVISISISFFVELNTQERTLKKVSSDRRTAEEHFFKNKYAHTQFKNDMKTACTDVYRAQCEERLKNSSVPIDINKTVKCPINVLSGVQWIVSQFNNSLYVFHEIIECKCYHDRKKIMKPKQILDQHVLDIIDTRNVTFSLLTSEAGNSYYVLEKANRYRPDNREYYFITEYWIYE